MMRFYGRGIRVSCDETQPRACTQRLDIEPIGHGAATIDGVVSAARAHGWRAHLTAHRRDLCPEHHMRARRRLTLLPAAKGRS